MAELDSRKQTILQAIVLEYVTGAEPVGSEMLVQKYQLGVKSATVRNEMAEMLDLGFLVQPHTSSGRIPTDLGYRYYVDRLIVTRDPEENVKQKLKDSTSDGEALQSLLQDSLRALSRLTQLLAVATVHETTVTIRTAVLSALGPKQALMVLVLSNGRVENRMIECPKDLTLDDVGKANDTLTSAIAGKNLRAVSRLKIASTSNSTALDKLMSVALAQVRLIARDITRGTVVTEGEEFLFAQPEFIRDAGTLTELLRDLGESDILFETISPSESAKPVTIGRENRHEQMRNLSIIRHSFFVGNMEAGVVALVGPTRMRYDAGIPLITFTAKALSDSLTRYFA
jgi:heat-inducible transcriptional repressor